MAVKINRNWVVLGAALLVGLGAAFAVQRYISQRIQAVKPSTSTGPTIAVVVATDDLPEGTRLSAQNVAVRQVPAEWGHSNAIRPERFDQAQNAKLAVRAQRGEPILWAQIEGRHAATFSSRLVTGRRAITVAVDEISSISGMLAPGDTVDLMASVRRNQSVAMLPVLEHVKVLATGTQVQPGGRAGDEERRTFTTVTLDATPDEARRIMAAREVGRITALLRAPGDDAPLEMRASDALALLGMGGGEPVSVGPSPVQVLYGGRQANAAARPLPMAAPEAAPESP